MPVYDARQLGADHHVTTDCVVIGTGAGGATAAAELAAAGVDVVMLEEGGYHTGRDMHGDAYESFQTLYRNGGLTGTLGRPPIVVPLGCCVGGTTTVNSGTSYRTPDFVLQRWEREYGLEGATDLAHDYDAVERNLDIKPVADELYGPQHAHVEAAAKRLGWAASRIPRNESGCMATGTCAMGCPSDGKMAMSVSRVPAALERGTTLWTHARVRRLLHHRRRAFGVAAEVRTADGATRSLVVTAELVVVACGALHTPAFLLGNGVRDRWLGRNLHMHPATRVVARFPEPIRGWQEVPQAYNIDEFIAEGFFLQGQFVPPEIQAPIVPGWGHAHEARMAEFARLSSFGALVSDSSAGRVWAKPGDVAPVAYYQLNRPDKRTLLRAIAKTAELFFAAGAEEVYSGVASLPVLHGRDDAAKLERLRVPVGRIEMMAFHPMGTARAAAPALGVCDPWGRVRGWSGLAIADGSLLPTSNKINPQLTIMALARRAARTWAQ